MLRSSCLETSWNSVRFGNASYAGKTSNAAFLSYSCPGVLRNQGLDRLLGEAPTGQRADRAQAAPDPARLALGPFGLGFELRQSSRGGFVVHTLRPEVGPDPIVAVAAV